MDYEEDPKIQKMKIKETERILDKLIGGLMPTKARREFFHRMRRANVKATNMEHIRSTTIDTIKVEVRNCQLEPTEEDINRRIGEILQEHSDPNQIQQIANEVQNRESKLENKFGIKLKGKKWFQCTIEEVKYSTFTNMPVRNVDYAYVIINDDNFEIYKESVWIKTNMGSRKIYFTNITSIDYDARGRLHASSSVIINTKSAEHIQLKFVSQKVFVVMNTAYENYIDRENRPPQPIITNVSSGADELLKYGELLEKGLITQEEFNIKKAEIFNEDIKPHTNETPINEEKILQVSEYKFCPECGVRLEPGAKFCIECGFKLEE